MHLKSVWNCIALNCLQFILQACCTDKNFYLLAYENSMQFSKHHSVIHDSLDLEWRCSSENRCICLVQRFLFKFFNLIILRYEMKTTYERKYNLHNNTCHYNLNNWIMTLFNLLKRRSMTIKKYFKDF